MQSRQLALQHWLAQQIGHTEWRLQPLTGDASFRYYFRLQVAGRELIAVDTPAEKANNNRGFVAVTRTLAEAGLTVPEILAADCEAGFMLLTFIEGPLYYHALNAGTANTLYQQALQALVRLQACHPSHDYAVPPYDEALLRRELMLFVDWFCDRYLELELTATEQQFLERAFVLLIENALTQPQVYVHRDYHSRNLIALDTNRPGILDYQDAVIGPITYDAVSLLRDGYMTWPVKDVERWLLYFYNALETNAFSFDAFSYWFEWMGVQRHLKIIGIFARKYVRDANAAYLNDIPRALNYLMLATQNVAPLQDLHRFLLQRVVPAWHERQHPTVINNEALTFMEIFG